MLVQVQAAPLRVLLPADALDKVLDSGLVFESLPLKSEMWKKHLAAGFALVLAQSLLPSGE